MHTLRLDWAKRSGEGCNEFLDYLVDDQSVLDWIRWCAPDPDQSRDLRDGYVSPFHHAASPDLRDAAYRQLLGRSPPHSHDGRVALYVCPLCAGPDCGTITAVVRVTSATVEWNELAVGDACNVIAGLPGFTFERSAYTTALATARVL